MFPISPSPISLPSSSHLNNTSKLKEQKQSRTVHVTTARMGTRLSDTERTCKALTPKKLLAKTILLRNYKIMQSSFPLLNFKPRQFPMLYVQTLTFLWPVLLHFTWIQTNRHCVTYAETDCVNKSGQTHNNSISTLRLLTSSHCVHTPSWTDQGDLCRTSLQLMLWKIQPKKKKWVQHAAYIQRNRATLCKFIHQWRQW